MEISAAGQSQSLINSEMRAEEARELYGVKLLKMAQETEAVEGELLEDTVEFSEEAMQHFLAEQKA